MILRWTGCWLNQPLWKIILCSSKWGIFPNVRGENFKKMFELPLARIILLMVGEIWHPPVEVGISRVLYIQPVVVRDFWSINNRNPPTYTGLMSREPTYRCAHNSTNRGEITSVTPLIRPFIGVRAPFKTSHCMTPTQTSCNFLEGNPSKRPTFVFIPPPPKKGNFMIPDTSDANSSKKQNTYFVERIRREAPVFLKHSTYSLK